MGYTWEILGKLDDKAISSSGETIDEYITRANCTAVRFTVTALQNTGTQSTAANFHSKVGTFKISASPSIVGGDQVNIDADDIPPMLTMLSPYARGDIRAGVEGTATDDRYQHFEYYVPFSPDPYQPTFGFEDARLKIEFTSTETNTDGFRVTVEGLIHDQMPEYYIETKLNTFTGATGNATTDLKLPKGGILMGAYAMGTTSLQDLTTSDAPSIRRIGILRNNTVYNQQHGRCMNAERPRGVYMVGGTTVTVVSPDYMFYDVGWRKGQGVPIGDDQTYLRVTTAAADAINVYPLVAMRSVYK